MFLRLRYASARMQRSGLAGAAGDIASVAEVFRLQGDERMREIEKAYLR